MSLLEGVGNGEGDTPKGGSVSSQRRGMVCPACPPVLLGVPKKLPESPAQAHLPTFH